MKALHTECGTPVLFILYNKHVQKISRKEWRKKMKLTDQWQFSANREPQTSKTDDSDLTRKTFLISYLHASYLVSQLIFLSRSVYSLNPVIKLYIKVWKIGFLGEIDCSGKILFLGKICWKEDADYRHHFSRKKKPWIYPKICLQKFCSSESLLIGNEFNSLLHRYSFWRNIRDLLKTL